MLAGRTFTAQRAPDEEPAAPGPRSVRGAWPRAGGVLGAVKQVGVPEPVLKFYDVHSYVTPGRGSDRPIREGTCLEICLIVRAGAGRRQHLAQGNPRSLWGMNTGRADLPLVDGDIFTIRLVTHGARSGVPRRVEIWAHRVEGGLFLVGSNWGKAQHPAWYHNVVATPRVVVEVDDESYELEARIARGDERDRLFAVAVEHFARYRDFEDSAGREIPIVVLQVPATCQADRAAVHLS